MAPEDLRANQRYWYNGKLPDSEEIPCVIWYIGPKSYNYHYFEYYTMGPNNYPNLVQIELSGPEIRQYVALPSFNASPLPLACEHDPVDTGMRVLWCKKCNEDGEYILGNIVWKKRRS